MQGPLFPPTNFDLSRKDVNIRTQIKQLFECIFRLGRLTTDYTEQYAKEEAEYNRMVEAEVEMDEPTTFLADQEVKLELQQLYDAWLGFMVVQSECIHEIRVANGVRYTIASYIFVELARLHLLLHQPTILKEQDNLACFPMSELTTESYLTLQTLERTKHGVWVEIANSYKESLDDKADGEEDDIYVVELLAKVNALWKTPIVNYKQSQIRIMLLFLTQQLNSLHTVDKSIVQEFKHVFGVLMIRIGQLFNPAAAAAFPAPFGGGESGIETPFDETDESELQGESMAVKIGAHPVVGGGGGTLTPSLPFNVFCALYAGGILRRLFYYDMLILNRMPPLQQRIVARHNFSNCAYQWILKITNSFADEAFEDMFTSIVPEGYNFVGDDLWFKYYWPHKVHSRGACITALRPHLHKRFFSEVNMNRETVLKACKTSHLSRLFVLKAIDEYLHIQLSQVAWMNACVVYNEDIEYMASVLELCKVPVILQVFSSFWLYDECKVHVSDDLFEVIGMWFYMIKSKYACKLYDADMTGMVKEVFSSNA